jgi:uncharacterized repeat protein (TIGR01451 family)
VQQECDYSDSLLFMLNPALDLMMTKRATLDGVQHNGRYANPVSVLYKDTILYEITAVNANLRTGKVVISDTLPAYLKYVANSAIPVRPSSGVDIADGATASGTPPRDTLRWSIPNVPSYDTVQVRFKATPESGASASQPLFVNRAWVRASDTIPVQTNGTYHQGAGVSVVTFSATTGGSLYNIEPQALDYRTSPRVDNVLIVPDSGYVFAGWRHDDYYSLRGELIPADSGLLRLDSITIYGDVELRAEFLPEADAPKKDETAPAAKETGDDVWSHKETLRPRQKRNRDTPLRPRRHAAPPIRLRDRWRHNLLPPRPRPLHRHPQQQPRKESSG